MGKFKEENIWVCIVCGKEYHPIRSNQKFCSSHCKNIDKYQRCKANGTVSKYDKNMFHTKEKLLRKMYWKQKQRSKMKSRYLLSYSIEEFLTFGINNINYNKIYDEWENSNYEDKLLPTTDRIDPEKGYAIDNIRFITRHDNTVKGVRQDCVILRKKYVYKYNLKMELMERYLCIRDAAKMNGTITSGISACCNKKQWVAYRYIWSFNEFSDTEKVEYINNIKYKRVRYNSRYRYDFKAG